MLRLPPANAPMHTPPDVTPRSTPRWPGAVTSPGLAVAPEAVDYFFEEQAQVRSWRALNSLLLVAGGRCVVGLSAGAINQAFIPGDLDSDRPPPLFDGPADAIGHENFHPEIFALGVAGAICGLCVHIWGVGRFYSDTARINNRRAVLVASGGLLGALLVAGGSAQASYATIIANRIDTYSSLPMRVLGNFLVYLCLPLSFSAAEIVHGKLPVKHRIALRDFSFALGGAMLMLQASLSLPDPPGPLWAREIAMTLGVIGVAAGGALPRADAMTAQAAARQLQRTRRLASIAGQAPPPAQTQSPGPPPNFGPLHLPEGRTRT